MIGMENVKYFLEELLVGNKMPSLMHSIGV